MFLFSNYISIFRNSGNNIGNGTDINISIYPIADNEVPRLSADRLEYNFSAGLTLKRVWEINDIKECYSDITIWKTEMILKN